METHETIGCRLQSSWPRPSTRKKRQLVECQNSKGKAPPPRGSSTRCAQIGGWLPIKRNCLGIFIDALAITMKKEEPACWPPSPGPLRRSGWSGTGCHLRSSPARSKHSSTLRGASPSWLPNEVHRQPAVTWPLEPTGGSLSKTEERQDNSDHDNQPNDIDDAIH